MPNFEKRGGLIPAVAQDCSSNEILMLAYVNEKAFRLSVETGYAHYFSTSKKEIWKKGDTSECFQRVHDILVDCDGDAIVYIVTQRGEGACHTMAHSCFFRSCFRGQIMDAPKAGPKEKLEIVEIGT